MLLFFIDSYHYIAPYLAIIFNKILDSGISPVAASKGVIISNFK
jgi:hypothetical protein